MYLRWRGQDLDGIAHRPQGQGGQCRRFQFRRFVQRLFWLAHFTALSGHDKYADGVCSGDYRWGADSNRHRVRSRADANIIRRVQVIGVEFAQQSGHRGRCGRWRGRPWCSRRRSLFLHQDASETGSGRGVSSKCGDQQIHGRQGREHIIGVGLAVGSISDAEKDERWVDCGQSRLLSKDPKGELELGLEYGPEDEVADEWDENR